MQGGVWLFQKILFQFLLWGGFFFLKRKTHSKTMSKKRIGGLLYVLMVTLALASMGYAAHEYFSLPGRIAGSLQNHTTVASAGVILATDSFARAALLSICTILVTAAVLLFSHGAANTQVVYVKQRADEQKEAELTDDGQERAVDLSEMISAVNNAAHESSPTLKASQEKVLAVVCQNLEASQAALFIAKKHEGKRILELFATYAYHIAESKAFHYEFGEGLAGQVAKEGRLVNIKRVPDGYITILSGLGSATPTHLVIAPVIYNEQVVAVIEVASFIEFRQPDEEFIHETARIIGNLLADRFADEESASLVAAPFALVN